MVAVWGEAKTMSYRWIALVLLISALLFGCSEEPATKVDFTDLVRSTVSTQERAITFAYLPQYSHTVSFERQRRLVEYLRRETGLPIRQLFPDTFDEHEKMVNRGEIDISFSNPFTYIKIAEQGARAFARVVGLSGRPEFHGQLICRDDNVAIKTIEDCRGKSWIAVDPTSAGGYLFLLGLFHDHGLHVEDFSDLAFAPGPGGKQEKVVLSVFAGLYDIGSVRDGTLELLEGKVDLSQIRVFAESPPYPSWVYSARKDFPQDIVDRIATAMFKLDISNTEDAEILYAARVSGYIPAKDTDYDTIRELVTKLNLF